MLSIKNNDEDIKKIIISSDKDYLNSTNDYGETAMHAACESNNLECVKLLYEHGADPEKMDNLKHPPIDTAAKGGHFLIVKYLIQTVKVHQHNTLRLAAFYGWVDIVDFMLESFVYLDCHLEHPIFISCRGNQPIITKRLLEYKMRREPQPHLKID